MFDLKNNPFYILEVSPQDKRATIISKSEEKAFFLDDGSCEAAQSTLLNPYKRLWAELDWFLDADHKRMSEICENIAQNKEISTESLSPLSKINALLFNLDAMQNAEAYDIGFVLAAVDEQFGCIDTETLMNSVNVCRQAAGLKVVTEMEVEEAIGAKRNFIRQLFAEKLQLLSDDDYTKFVTILAKKYVVNANYDEGIVILDALDQYEIRMQSSIESYTEDILNYIKRIQSLSNENEIKRSLQTLLKKVKEWDIVVYPLQVRSMSSGLPHENSTDVGREIREIMLWLHNENALTESAFKLAKEMQNIFEEIEDLAELFANDARELDRILKETKEAKDIVAQMEAFKQSADRLCTYPTASDVDAFISKIKALNAKIKQSTMDSEIKGQARTSICYIARGAAISLHNERHLTNYAYKISSVLSSLFSDLTDLKGKLNEDVSALQRQLMQASLGTYRRTSSGGCYIATCVYGSYDCPEVWTLRRYRDETLGSTWYGRLFIRIYYFVSPKLVKWFGKTRWFKKIWQKKLDRMVAKLQGQGVENTPYEDKKW